MGDLVIARRALLVAGLAVVLVSCGPTSSPDVVSGDAGSVTGSTRRSLSQTIAASARVAALRQRFRIEAVRPDLRLPGRTAPTPTTTRAVIGPSIATGFHLVGADEVRPELPDGAKRAVLKSATVKLPVRADGTTRIEDDASHVAVAVTLRGASSAPVSVAKGIAVYARALPDGDVVHRPSADGTEDYVAFDRAPTREELVYDVDVSRAAGLRLVANTLEFMDKDGAPRLRVAPPWIAGADGARRAATLSVAGCSYDTDSRAPWGRDVTAPGATHCHVRVTWGGVAYPALVDPAWVTTGSMATTRDKHTATLLDSGRVLVVGGYNEASNCLSSAEIYDPASRTFAATGSLATARGEHTASHLASDTVLIVGGTCFGALATFERYVPALGKFITGGTMSRGRVWHTATVLPSGDVLVAGGRDDYVYLSSALLYDTVLNEFFPTGSMSNSRVLATATLLESGKVLVAGGDATTMTLSSADLYDPVSGMFAKTGSMADPRSDHTATLLPSGQVLIAGGYGSTALSSAELYDPVPGTFSPTGSLSTTRSGHAATALDGGTVLVTGGHDTSSSLSSTELYVPAMGAFLLAPTMHAVRSSHSATLLPSGSVLVAGGEEFGAYSVAVRTAELYTPGVPGSSCSALQDCASGICDGGVCCAAICTGTCMACAPATGACVPVIDAQDPDTCTGSNTCDATGVCRKKVGQTCVAADECASGFCADGYCCNTACAAGPCDACSVAAGAATDGTCTLLTGSSCDDGDACTQTDTCVSGACVGSDPVPCAALDQCHDIGVCDPASGACSDPAKADGTTCDDGNACTQTDTCGAGTCTGGSPVTCAALDDCHEAGTCDPATGACTKPAKADGAACAGGVCQAGTCTTAQDGGAGGSAGSGGNAGAAGASTGGSAGTSTGGSTGSGGSAAVSGSAGASTGGSAGMSGSAGASTGGSAGVSGSAGASSGGSGGAAGSGGTGGSGATGGSRSGTGGSSSSGNSGGCGCSTAGSDHRSGAPWLVLVGLGLLGFRRRK